MKVYVLRKVEQDGSTILGVYASEVAAKEAAPKAELGEWWKTSWGDEYWRADSGPWTSYDVEGWEVTE